MDALTGTYSKHAYVDVEDEIDKKINEKTMENFALVVFDLNDLKSINDTYGHEAGDKYLVDSTKLIAEYYKDIPIYRIGGDEFVVLLKDENYERRQELFDAFNERIEKNRIENQRVIVPSGLAEFEPSKDTTITKVFTRADRRMYERKQQLKETINK